MNNAKPPQKILTIFTNDKYFAWLGFVVIMPLIVMGAMTLQFKYVIYCFLVGIALRLLKTIISKT